MKYPARTHVLTIVRHASKLCYNLLCKNSHKITYFLNHQVRYRMFFPVHRTSPCPILSELWQYYFNCHFYGRTLYFLCTSPLYIMRRIVPQWLFGICCKEKRNFFNHLLSNCQQKGIQTKRPWWGKFQSLPTGAPLGIRRVQGWLSTPHGLPVAP